MPWKEVTMKKQREIFVKQAIEKQKSISELCREYEISRPTAYKWIKRYQNGEDLNDRSKRPFHTANKISPDIEKLIVERRKQEKAIGAVKQRKMLQNEGYEVPSISTFNAVFKRNHLVTHEASEAAKAYKRFEKENSNDMWQADFKGNYATKDNTRIHPLSIIDDHSRFCISGDAQITETYEETVPNFISAFRKYGLPKTILCDNGNPWGLAQTSGITTFEVFMMNQGILVTHIRAKTPRIQGKVERFNGSFKRERLAFYTPENYDDAVKQRLEYVNFYNNIRPHESIGLKVPSQVYKRSNREYSEKISEWIYDDSSMIRRVKETGYFNFNGRGFYLSEALGNLNICLVPTSTDGVFYITYRQFRIGILNLNENALTSRKIYLLHNDPRFKDKD